MKQWEKIWGTKYILASHNSPGKDFAKEISIDETGISVQPVLIAASWKEVPWKPKTKGTYLNQ